MMTATKARTPGQRRAPGAPCSRPRAAQSTTGEEGRAREKPRKCQWFDYSNSFYYLSTFYWTLKRQLKRSIFNIHWPVTVIKLLIYVMRIYWVWESLLITICSVWRSILSARAPAPTVSGSHGAKTSDGSRSHQVATETPACHWSDGHEGRLWLVETGHVTRVWMVPGPGGILLVAALWLRDRGYLPAIPT